jgi:hypothetical protein
MRWKRLTTSCVYETNPTPLLDCSRGNSIVVKIFISYTSSDKEWAQWIGWELQQAGHEPFIHDWEIGAGENIAGWMEQRFKQADRLIGIFSDLYCKAAFSQSERWAAYWKDPRGRDGFFVPIEVRRVSEWPAMVDSLKRLSLVDLDESEASRRLISFLQPAQSPTTRPTFPGNNPPLPVRVAAFVEGSEPLGSSPPSFPAPPIEDKSAEARAPIPPSPTDRRLGIRYFDDDVPKPQVYGREIEIETIVDSLLGGRTIFLIGGPGMGKTTVTNAAFYDQRILTRFGKRRVSVSLVTATEPRAILVKLVEVLGFPSTGDDASLLRALEIGTAEQPLAALLDDAETMIVGDPIASARIFNLVESIQNLSLVITARSAPPPISDEFDTFHLSNLSQSAERHAFLAVAGNSFRDDPDLLPLLKTLEGHPLTIRLVAAQAIGAPSLKGLRESWEDAYEAILRMPHEAEGLDTGVRASLALSLNSMRMKATPLARRLLATLAALPDGLAEVDVPLLLGNRGTVTKTKANEAIVCLHQLRLAERLPGQHLRINAPLRQYVQEDVPILNVDRPRLEKLLKRQKRENEKDEAQRPRTSRAKLAEVASPAPFLLPDGRLDAGPNPTYDVPIDSPDLPTLPIRQLALIEIIVGDLPRNAPRHLKSTLNTYRDELIVRGLNPILGLLKDMAAIIDAAAGASNAKLEWLDEGMIAAFERFDANHQLFLQHFPLDPKRETLYALTPVDEEMATGATLSKPFEEVAKASDEANKAGLTTNDFVKIVDKMTEFARVIASQSPPAPANKPEAAATRRSAAIPDIRPEDRINVGEAPVSPKKRIVLSGIGFLERAYNLLGSSATLMGPPEGNALLNALRAAITALSKLLGL